MVCRESVIYRSSSSSGRGTASAWKEHSQQVWRAVQKRLYAPARAPAGTAP